MSPSVKAVTRVSQTLADYIASLSENENAATRALILLGAAELGLDPTLVEDDLRLTMAARLPPELYAKLQALRERVNQRALTPAVTTAPVAPAQRDPGVGAPAVFPEPIPTPVRRPVVEAQRATPDSATGAPATADAGAGAPPGPGPASAAPLGEPSAPADTPLAPAIRPAEFVHREDSVDDADALDPFSGVGFDFDEPAS